MEPDVDQNEQNAEDGVGHVALQGLPEDDIIELSVADLCFNRSVFLIVAIAEISNLL